MKFVFESAPWRSNFSYTDTTVLLPCSHDAASTWFQLRLDWIFNILMWVYSQILNVVYSIFSEFYSLISLCYYPGLHKVQNYLDRKVWKKMRVQTPSKIIKLIYYYTHIILSSYTNFGSDKTIIHKDTYKHITAGLLLWTYSSIGIATKHTRGIQSWCSDHLETVATVWNYSHLNDSTLFAQQGHDP